MHPGMMYWWKNRQAAMGGGCGSPSASDEWAGHEGHCGPGHGRRGHGSRGWEEREASGEEFGGGSFGVRRPLRFLAHKLELDERQVGELARILSELKTERAQADVDGRRSISAFADAVAGTTFDEGKAAEAAAQRVRSAERLRDAVHKALREIHALLAEDQRAQLAYLIRTGVVTL